MATITRQEKIKSPIILPNVHIVRGDEEVFSIDHTDWNVDDLLYIDIVGTTLPSADYCAVREEGHNHWRDQYVFEYVLSGRGTIECGRQTYTVGPGDLYFLNRLHSHRYYADPDDPFCKLWINVSGRLVNSLVELYGISEGVVVRHHDAEGVFREMHSLVAGLTTENRSDVCNALGLHIHALLQILARSDQREADIHDNANRALQIKRYIDQNNNFDLSLDDIAAHFFLNKVYLTRVFRAAYGVTPKQYILSRRIEAAKNMLSNSGTSMQEIAALLHFASTQHFSAAFHRAVGMTPGEYRRQYS